MSNMHQSVQEPNPQYVVRGHDCVAGTSNGEGKSSEGNAPSPASGEGDEAQAISELVQAWMQRLQILTIVTAFLSSMDGELFSLTALDTQIGDSMSATARELVYACLAGALIFHICSTILGYVASFALIRYEIRGGEDDKSLPRRIVLDAIYPLRRLTPQTSLQLPERLRFLSVSRRSSRVGGPPLVLLTRCYHTILCLTAVGFVLAVTGILVYTWAGLRMAVGISSTICLGICISAGVWAITA